jgi:ABC-2 type transport system permease protein
MQIVKAHIYATLVPLIRAPAYWIPMVVFPTLLFSFFGLQASQRMPDFAPVMMGSWSAFAVIGIAFFQFGISVAQSREDRWQHYARTLAAAPWHPLIGQIVAALFFIILALGLLWGLIIFTTDITVSLSQLAQLLGVLLLGSIPFVVMGVSLGYAFPVRAAVPIANLLYLPLSFFGGLWVPPNSLPGPVAAISPYTPTRQLGELAWAVMGERPLPAHSLMGLLAYTGAFTMIAMVLWRRDESARYR